MKKNYNNQKNSSFLLSFIAIFLVVVSFGGIFMNFSNIKDIFKKLSEDELPVETPVEDSTDDNDELVKQLYCQYDPTISFEKGVGGLRIFVPTYNGYINYNFVHTVYIGANGDIWRLGQAYAFDDNLENEYALTPAGAEWDMAITLQGRSDFIGGYAHGDEKYTSLTVFVDGVQKNITSMTSLTSFDELIILETSIGYDPLDNVTEVLEHQKKYVINENGIVLDQRVKWLGDFTIASSYLAMMPPLKTLTDKFYLDTNYTPSDIKYGFYSGVKEAVVFGSTSNISYSMSVPKYPVLPGGDAFLITDNGGGAYNKMYFVICNGATVQTGDIWETTTVYKIVNG